ncbi:hypothetical protein BC629DRAFT_1515491 [Irpex lacteus]|nr:hypothetical protein BC629DRAFT_1515491 [Irpex lacteus]
MIKSWFPLQDYCPDCALLLRRVSVSSRSRYTGRIIFVSSSSGTCASSPSTGVPSDVRDDVVRVVITSWPVLRAVNVLRLLLNLTGRATSVLGLAYIRFDNIVTVISFIEMTLAARVGLKFLYSLKSKPCFLLLNSPYTEERTHRLPGFNCVELHEYLHQIIREYTVRL